MTMIQEGEGSFLSIASANGEITRVEIEKYKPGKEIILRLKIVGDKLLSEFSLNNKIWTPVGEPLDATVLSTRVAGGFVGTYLGLYTFAKSQAIAEFDWAEHKRLE